MFANPTFIFCLVAILSCGLGTLAKEATVRIINGHDIDITQAPYIVQLRDKIDDVFCGGTMVASQFVVTAGHCVQGRDMSEVTVVAGVTGRTDKGERRKISSTIVHPEYARMTMHSDAAVLKLDRPMSGENIKAIPLCQQALKEEDVIQVSGWGRLSFDVGSPEKLRTVRLPIASQESCAEEFRIFVKKNMFCASGLEPKGICFGDSGGPAYYRGQLCGIVAMSYKCGEVGYRSGFTNVFDIRQFIESAMRN